MKKMITVLAVCVLLSALLAAALPTVSAENGEFSYLELTHPADRLGEDKFVRWVIPWDGIFEDGQQYTFYANVRFGSDITDNYGCVYVNVYAYSSIDGARSSDYGTLVSRYDFAKAPPAPGDINYTNEWHEYSFTYNPMLRTYGSPHGETVKLEAITMTIGYDNANGTVGVRELGVKNEKGKVIYSKTFEQGLDFDEPNFYHSDDINAQTEGEGWSIRKAEDKPDYLFGDVNGDGAVNAKDYLTLKRHILGTLSVPLNEEQLGRCDINGDDSLNAKDYVMLKRYIIGTWSPA